MVGGAGCQSPRQEEDQESGFPQEGREEDGEEKAGKNQLSQESCFGQITQKNILPLAHEITPRKKESLSDR